MSALEPTTRPNGKIYRPRRPVGFTTFETGDGEGCAVLRTHDLETAYRIAWNWLMNEYGKPLQERLEWWRLVPWDAYGIGCDHSWVKDETRGTPAVVWFP